MTNNLLHLATGRFFYTHGLETIFIIAIIFTLIGLFCGWLMWRHCQAEALRVEKLNEDLRSDYAALEKEQGKLNTLIKNLSTEETPA